MRTLKSIGVAAVLTVSIAMPATAAAQGQDLRNPDQRSPSAQTQDLRNADRRGPATVEPVDAPAVTTIEAPAGGFDWGDAGIGAAGGVAVLTLLFGLAGVASHHRRGPHVPA